MNSNHPVHKDMKVFDMNFSQLQCLVALVETGSFTEAATRINLTQSAVSHALTALENELGVGLLERNRKGIVALTSAGEKIMPHVRTLLAQAEAIEQEARAAAGAMAGKVRIGSILSFSPGLLASILTRFQQQFPDIEVILFEGTMQEVAEWIESNIIDVGFVIHPGREVDSTLIAIDEQCVLVPLNHPLSTRKFVTPEDLYTEGFILAKKNECSIQLMESIGINGSQIQAAVRYYASDSATILAMVSESLGITLMPRMMLPKKLDGVVSLSFNPPQMLQIGLAVKSAATASPAAKLFIQTSLLQTQKQTSVLT